MTKDELKEAIKKNLKTTSYEKTVSEVVDEIEKDDEFTQNDFDCALKEVKRRIENKIREKSGNN